MLHYWSAQLTRKKSPGSGSSSSDHETASTDLDHDANGQRQSRSQPGSMSSKAAEGAKRNRPYELPPAVLQIARVRHCNDFSCRIKPSGAGAADSLWPEPTEK